ncbi:hypothetical protein EEL31_23730 [Brevibacillus laterosporus]|nr:hypothetical protein [Brevibacillus laterosporus]TPG71142.1 hypothetical protein EEL31_23730 [Brevibacillus laterosporus]
MDHAINSLSQFLEVELSFVLEEWRSGQYNKMCKCPSYYSAKALIDAIHIMEKYEYGNHRTKTIRQHAQWWG